MGEQAMTDNTMQQGDSTEDTGFELRELRRIINRHRRQHDRAARTFRDWQQSWSMNERVRDEQLTRIGNQLANRLRNLPPLNGVGEEVIEN